MKTELYKHAEQLLLELTRILDHERLSGSVHQEEYIHVHVYTKEDVLGHGKLVVDIEFDESKQEVRADVHNDYFSAAEQLIEQFAQEVSFSVAYS